MLKLSNIILGTMGFGHTSDSEQIKLIRSGLELGISSLDTAPLYGRGLSERNLGRAIAGRRDQYEILTKLGLRWDDKYGEILFTSYEEGQEFTYRRNCKPESIRQEIAASLSRLNTDYIDLIQVHHLDSGTPVSTVMMALESAKSTGMVREIGVCNYPVKAMSAAQQSLSCPLFSMQNLFNPIEQLSARAGRIFAANEKLEYLAYSPLAQGILAGRQLQNASAPDDWRSGTAYFDPDFQKKLNTILKNMILPLCFEKNCTLSQLILSWIMHSPGSVKPIVGASNIRQLTENASAATIQMTPEEHDLIAQNLMTCDATTVNRKPLFRRVKNRLKGILRRAHHDF